MKVMYDDAVWQPEQLKSCVMPTSGTVSRRPKSSAKQNKLFCSTSSKYSRMAVSLNSTVETAFARSNKWGIPLDCTLTDKKQVSGVYVGE